MHEAIDVGHCFLFPGILIFSADLMAIGHIFLQQNSEVAKES